ncbi:MAG: hypothetical protein DCC71_09935 [Proteobacteria bacterium]|nr:MAG: hypothetical protein DCC71_09935 [Pseudomonadota bacterium]
MLRRPASSPFLCALAVAVGAGLGAADAHALSGVCPDGSVFIVRRAADIPCSNARRVEPSDVPPLRPENLPRPYLWQLHQDKHDENNPYNLVDRAERMRGKLGQGAAPSEPGSANPGAGGAEVQPPQVASAPPTAPATPPAPRKLDLGLTDGELRDLFYLVELSQQSAPASFVEEAGGSEALRVSFAHSQAFETKLRAATPVDGTVVLFSVQPAQRQRFQPNFTFVQGETAYRPQPGSARQLDVLVGKLGGELGPEDLTLGYAVLPPSIDPARPVDLYWDDRRIAVTFRP